MENQYVIITCKKVLEDEVARMKEYLANHSENVSSEEFGEFEKGDGFAFQAVNRHNHHQARERLADDQAALMRIENGTFGICVDCGKKIPEERLLVISYASRCAPCQTRKGVKVR